jgi:hypothetical protein
MIVKGFPGATPQPTSYRFVAGQGWVTVLSWEGPKAAIQGLASVVQSNDGGQVGPTGDPTIWRAEVYIGNLADGSTEVPVDTWELDAGWQTKSLLQHPRSQALGSDTLRDVKHAAENPSIQVSFVGDAEILYDLLVRGQDSYVENNWVLRHTRSASRNFAATVATGGVNRLWTFAQILAFTMPSTISAAVTSLATPPYVEPVNYAWRWLKSAVTLQKAFLDRTLITETWTLEMWSTFTYNAA